MSKRLSLMFFSVVLGLCVGCGTNSQTPVQLSGTVTYKAQPLHGGNITFHTADHGMLNTTINRDGTYQVSLPAESMKVTIETESFDPDKIAPVYGTSIAGGKKASGGGENAMKSERMKAEGKGDGGGDGSGSFGPPPKDELAKLFTKIPAKYKFKETSGFSLQLENGKQVKDFELTD